MTIKRYKSADALTYDNAPRAWVEARSQRPLFGQDSDFPAYWTKPENINSFLHAQDTGIENIYNNPDESPISVDYSTSAANPDNFGALFAIGKPKNNLTQFRPYYESDGYSHTPREKRNLFPEMVYQHELGHFYDPRINKFNESTLSAKALIPYKKLLDRGFNKKIAAREAPAISDEWDFRKRSGF